MSKNTKEVTEIHFDTRTRQRYLDKGVITPKDYESYLANLPNDAENFELATFEDDDLTLDATHLESVSDYSDESDANDQA